jgi:hypothetical protein
MRFRSSAPRSLRSNASTIKASVGPRLGARHGGGILPPMRDVIRLASNSHHYLVIYHKHTEEPLYLARTKRLASAGQRIVLHAHDCADGILVT